MTDEGIETRLAVYGSLAPGKENHGQLDGLSGTWQPGTVRGHLHAEGWGATMGYTALRLDPEASEVPVLVFESADLPAHWARLDDFEGEDYRREPCTVATAQGPVTACVYAVAGEAGVKAPRTS